MYSPARIISEVKEKLLLSTPTFLNRSADLEKEKEATELQILRAENEKLRKRISSRKMEGVV